MAHPPPLSPPPGVGSRHHGVHIIALVVVSGRGRAVARPSLQDGRNVLGFSQGRGGDESPLPGAHPCV